MTAPNITLLPQKACTLFVGNTPSRQEILDWLEQLPISDKATRESIFDRAIILEQEDDTAYPSLLMLDMLAEYYSNLPNFPDLSPAIPKNFGITVDGYKAELKTIIGLLETLYSPQTWKMLQMLSLTNGFDSKAFDKILKLVKPAHLLPCFDTLIQLSIILPYDDDKPHKFFCVQPDIATLLKAQSSRRKNAQVMLNIFHHFENRALQQSNDEVTEDAANATVLAASLYLEIFPDDYIEWVTPYWDRLLEHDWLSQSHTLWQEALNHFLQGYEEDHPYVLVAYNNLAFCLEEELHYLEAEQLYRKVLKIDVKSLGKENTETATSYTNLAYNLYQQGRHEEAKHYYYEALQINLEQLGSDHPTVAASMNNSAANLERAGLHGEAEPLYRKALAIREQTLGSDHKDTMDTYYNLANNLSEQERFQEAGQVYDTVLPIYTKVLGANHPETVLTVNHAAFNYLKQDKYPEAADFYRKVLQSDIRTTGESSLETAKSYENLAEALYLQDKYQEAEPLYRKALKTYLSTLGKNHPETVYLYNSLARTLHGLAQYEEAESLYYRSIELSETVNGADHPLTITFQEHLALMWEHRDG